MTDPDPVIGRWKTCVAAWPECESGYYDPSCCRFPKSCSAEVFLSEILEYPEHAPDVALYSGWFLAPNNVVERIPVTTEDHSAIPLHMDPFHERMLGTTYHSNIDFDVPYMTEITENLWQGGCDSRLLLPKNIEHVINLYPGVTYRIKHRLHSELKVRMYDDLDQRLDGVVALAHWVNSCRAQGPTLVHCQAGLNRSSLIVGTALIISGELTAQEAIDHIRAKRSPACLCNLSFEQFLVTVEGK